MPPLIIDLGLITRGKVLLLALLEHLQFFETCNELSIVSFERFSHSLGVEKLQETIDVGVYLKAAGGRTLEGEVHLCQLNLEALPEDLNVSSLFFINQCLSAEALLDLL